MPATITGARPGSIPGTASRSLGRHRREALELLLDGRERNTVAVRTRGVVLGVAEVERGERRHRSGDADRARASSGGKQRAHVPAAPRARAATAGPRRGSAP